jgi:hypothetical protein
MNTDEYIKLAKHLDSIGAFSAADLFEKNMIKTAAGDEPQRDINLQGQEPSTFFSRLEDLGRTTNIGFGKLFGAARESYIDGSFANMNSFIRFARANSLTKFEKKLLEAFAELEKVGKAKLSRTWSAPTRTDAKLSAFLSVPNLTQEDSRREFLNWSQAESQTYTGYREYYPYLKKLREAEVLLVNPSRATSVSPAPSSSPSASSGSVLGPAGTFPGGGSGGATAPSRRTPPTRSIMPGTPINEALALIVFKQLKSINSSAADADIHKSLRPEEKLSGYKFIGDDPSRISDIKAAIDATRYSPAKKQKLKQLLDKKIEDAREMAVTQAVDEAANGPETETTTPPNTTTESPISQFPSENTGNVAELDALIAELERKATGSDRTLFRHSFNADFRRISETFNRLRPNMNPSTAAIYDNKLERLQLAFIGAINE